MTRFPRFVVLATLLLSLAGGACTAPRSTPSIRLRNLDSGATIDGGTYGTVVINDDPPENGGHFVPQPIRSGFIAGMYRLVPSLAPWSYVAPEPASPPGLRIGQQFIRVVLVGRTLTKTTPELLTLSAIDRTTSPAHLTFARPPAPALTITSDADVAHVSEVRPLVLDDNLRRARAEFAGRDVWTRGIVELSCTAGLGKPYIIDVEAAIRVHIEAIDRVLNVPSLRGLGEPNDLGRARDAAFWTFDPLVVVTRIPSNAGMFGEGYTGPIWRGIEMPPRGCRIGTTDLADLWEVERMFSTVSPAAHHWTQSVQTAVAKREVVVGMPRGCGGARPRLSQSLRFDLEDEPVTALVL